jgi:peptidoglycan/xylan/chitin deacetylase (PgdA/CDA1 family)
MELYYVIKLLSELGHDIQSHGVSHKDLTTLSACDLEDEVGQSKQSLLEHDLIPQSSDPLMLLVGEIQR